MGEKYENLMMISECLYNLYEDGIELSAAFEILEDIHLSKKYKESIKTIRNKILVGFSISEGFRLFPKLYPKFFTETICVGENTGELTKVLKALNKYYSTRFRIRKEVINAMIYPILILTSMVIVFIILFFIVIPNMYGVIASMNKEVSPFITHMYNLNKWILNNKLVFVTGLVSWIIAFTILLIYIKEKRNKKINIIFLKIKVIKEYCEYIFILILSIIVKSSIPILSGIQFSMEASGNSIVDLELKNLYSNLIKGLDLTDCLSKNILLSKYGLSMIAIGENSGSLSNSLNSLENRLEKNLQGKIKKLISLASPVFILIMAAVILFFIYVLIVPIMNSIYSGYSQ